MAPTGQAGTDQPRWALVVIVVVLAVVVPAPALSAHDGDLEGWQQRYRPIGPLCGLFCVKGALSVIGIESPSLDEWIVPENFTGHDGSSANQLIKLIETAGGRATALSGLSLNSLRVMTDPVILHTTRIGPGRNYNHWVLFLGVDETGVRVCDFPGQPVSMSEAQLQAIWNGSGIIVSKNNVSLTLPITAVVIGDVLFPLLIAASVIVVFRRRRAGPKLAFDSGSDVSPEPTGAVAEQQRSSVFRAVAPLLTAIMLLGVARHGLLPDGMARNPDALSSVHFRFSPFVPHELTTWPEVARFLEVHPEAILVDTRVFVEFRDGTIPGAVSCPWITSTSERRTILAGIHQMRPLVLFCQSENCEFGHYLSRVLAVDGFRDLSVYVGGYVDWARHNSAFTRVSDDDP